VVVIMLARSCFPIVGLVAATCCGLAQSQRTLRVAGAQIPVTGDVEANVRALERALDYAASERAEVLLTPEGSLSGYHPNFDARRTAAALERLRAQARRSRIALALGTCFEEADGRRYDQVRVYDRDGTYLGFHAKILLCRRVADPHSKGEIDFFSTAPLRTFRIGDITVGALVCNDLWANPEWTPQPDVHLTQQLAERGARIIFHAVNSGLGQDEELALNRQFHESNLRLRARAAKLWIVVADAADPTGRTPSQCPSGVIDPSGRWALRVDSPGERFFSYTIALQ
jgi:predicted amidohydrolase